MKRILFLVVGLMISLATTAQVASRTQYGVMKLGNNMADSSGFVKIIFPPLVPSTAAVRAMFGGNSGIGYDQPSGLFYLQNAAVNTLIENKLKSYDGYDPGVSKVLSTTGSTFQWVVASVGGGSSSTVVTAQSPRDTALFYADSTLSRFTVTGTTSVTLSTIAAIRSFLSSTQTNVDAIVANGTYADGNEFAQTGNWTNVRFRAATVGGVTFHNSGVNNYATAFILNNAHSVNRVCIQGFKFTSAYTGTQSAINPVVWSTELVTQDGVEWVDNEITSNGAGVYNGFNMSQYSGQTSSGAVAKNIWFHRNYVHDMGRANEILSQGYDKPRIIGFVATNNRFTNMGLNDQHGFGLSKSGFIKGYLEKGNVFTNCRNIASEFVNVQYGISMNNTMVNSTSNVVTGYGISDDNVNLTRYLYIENNSVTTTGRPFYIYGSRNVTFSGGTYTGNYGVDMTTSSNCTFKNMTVNVYDKVSSGGAGTSFAWQVDTQASNNLFDNINVSSSNTIANGGLYAREVMVVKGSNNTIQNSTFTQGKQQNGSYYGFILVNSGTGNTLTNNQTLNGL